VATGLPDYYRGVRPRYGGALLAWGSKTVVKDIQNTLVGISGKGMIYGGAVWLDYTLTQGASQVWLGIDTYVVSNLSFTRLWEYGIVRPRSWPVHLLKYDSENFIYCVGISYGVTFENQVVLAYYEQNGFTPTVHYRLIYTLI